ncbi:MAG: hypothetical protein R3C59_16955 [Planctomycetaceae bacterium]
MFDIRRTFNQPSHFLPAENFRAGMPRLAMASLPFSAGDVSFAEFAKRTSA